MSGRSIKQLLKAAVPQRVLTLYDRVQEEASLSPAARRMRSLHRNGLPYDDCGSATAVKLAADWICRAQDRSQSSDGGVARHFSLNTGWSPSYPETTGYIVPTFLRLEEDFPGNEYGARARKMLDWLVRPVRRSSKK